MSNLKNIKDKRMTFRGLFDHIKYFDGYMGKEKKIKLINITDKNDTLMAESLWFNYTKGFADLGILQKNDIIEFNGRCKEYVAGHLDYEGEEYIPYHDAYKISNPTKIKKIDR